MSANKGELSAIRRLANEYQAATGETVYSGHSGGVWYFADKFVYGYEAALEHMKALCAAKGIEA